MPISPRPGRTEERIAAGADAVMIDVHPDPENALCDGPQALYARDFAEFAQHVGAHAALVGRRVS